MLDTMRELRNYRCMSFLILVAALALPAAEEQPVRCAAANAVLAGILEQGSPTDEDQAAAARFRAIADQWRALAAIADPAGQSAADAAFEKEKRGLARLVTTSGDPGVAQTILESRLADCDGAGDPDGSTEFGDTETNAS
jgi:hypothetical protein